MSLIKLIENGEVYEVSFPYDEHIVSMIKEVPGRQWHPSSKIWTIGKDRLGFFLKQLEGTIYADKVDVISSEHINENATLDSTNAIPNVSIDKVQTYCQEGSDLYPHQKDFLKWALYRQHTRKDMSGFILADEPGLGKTIETMNLALYNKRNSMFEHCLIVCCVNTAKYNWYDDILKHTNGKYHPYILGSRKKRDGSIRQKDLASKDKLADLQTGHMFGDVNEPLLPYFLITNIESFRVRNGKHMPFTEQVINMILEGHINMIALDEIHKNASPSSTQGKQLLNIKKKTGDKCMWIPITGTPIVSRPTDVFTPLKLIGKATCRDYYSWCQQYCIYGGFGDKEVVGYKNIGQLKYLLQGNMLRRLKSEVLDLPPIIFNDVFVENSKYQSKLYKSVLEDVQANKESILSSINPMSALLRLRQVNGSPELVDDELEVDSQYPSMNAKLSKLFELLYEIVSRGEKVVIFSNWVAPLRTLYKFIHKQYSVSVYTGTLSDSEREAQKQKFMNDDSCEILLGTIGAAGVSHTFTVAQNVIFYDEPWTYADKQQAWERVHRIGTKGTINVYTLITRNTVDDSVHDIVYNKKHISNYIVDGQIDLKSNPALFDLLLSDTVRR